MAKTKNRKFAEVGMDPIDFQRILDADRVAGLKHLLVRQGVTKHPPLEAIAISFANMNKLNM